MTNSPSTQDLLEIIYLELELPLDPYYVINEPQILLKETLKIIFDVCFSISNNREYKESFDILPCFSESLEFAVEIYEYLVKPLPDSLISIY